MKWFQEIAWGRRWGELHISNLIDVIDWQIGALDNKIGSSISMNYSDQNWEIKCCTIIMLKIINGLVLKQETIRLQTTNLT